MADNASITILRNTQANIDAEPIKDGNILFTTDQSINNAIYTDVGTKRIKIGGTVPIDSTITANSVNPVTSKAIYSEIDDVRGQICTNLLNPTAPTEINNGITFTNNGDGTFTINGKATTNLYFALHDITDFNTSGQFKLIGCPQGGSDSTYCVYIDCYNNGTCVTGHVEYGDGKVWTKPPQVNGIRSYIKILSGVAINNLTFKPMLTTDLSATYDDFVPYTGDSGRLNEDVANLVKGISPITNSEIDTILNS